MALEPITYFYTEKGYIACPACFPIISMEVYALYRGKGSDKYCRKNHRFHNHSVVDETGKEYTLHAVLPSVKDGDIRMKTDKQNYPAEKDASPLHFLCDYCPPAKKFLKEECTKI